MVSLVFTSRLATSLRKVNPLPPITRLWVEQQNTLISPIDGIVLGMATIPTVKPGEPVCHIAQPTRKLSAIRNDLSKLQSGSLYTKIREDLATNITVIDNEGLMIPSRVVSKIVDKHYTSQSAMVVRPEFFLTGLIFFSNY